MRELTLRTRDPEQTRGLAATIARSLRPGDVVALTGELGAGKTCFVQGAAAALGVADRVTSPSFVLCRTYEGPIPVVHVDVYRLDSLAEVAELGFEEIFDAGLVTFIEWGDAMSALLPPEHLEVELRLEDPLTAPDPEDSAQARVVVVRPRGDSWLRRLADLGGALEPWRRPDQEG